MTLVVRKVKRARTKKEDQKVKVEKGNFVWLFGRSRNRLWEVRRLFQMTEQLQLNNNNLFYFKRLY